MRIENLYVKNFRNIKFLNIENFRGVNFFIGENGSGKTNILESISIASNLKSFRNADDRDMITWDQNVFHISVKDEMGNCYEVGFSHEEGKIKKRTRLNGNQVKKASDFYSRLLTVFFGPDDNVLVNGSPEKKRRYIDSVIAKVSNDYILSLNELRKIVSSRNIILKEIKERRKKESDLDIWDNLFAEKSSFVINKRKQIIIPFSSNFKESYENISDMVDIPEIVYKPSIDSTDRSHILQTIEKNRKKDILSGTTLLGPHRDNYYFMKDSMDISSYASQGQIRIAAITLKCAEKNLIENIKKEKSILVVDDVFSELDDKRRMKLVSELSQGNQVFFSMVKVDEKIKARFEDISLFEVNEGKVSLTE
jgi:DNA replication and repair protein RecF